MNEVDAPGPTSHSFISQRLRLHYLDWGNPNAPTLVLVHGGRDHARSWDWIARALRRDWHIIAPDLRGHGDSAWSPDGVYLMPYYIYDLAQLLHQQSAEKVTIVAHSLGGAISLRYAGLYPEKIDKLVAIEGVGFTLKSLQKGGRTSDQTWRDWIDGRRAVAGRTPRRYASLEDALARMRAENRHLSEDQARHLTIHGASRNEDGSYSWKFDNYVRSAPPLDLDDEEVHALWRRIACPVLLAFGRQSWVSDPSEDGSAGQFQNARVEAFDNAGHWLHHDQLDRFLEVLKAFLHPGAAAGA